MPEPGRQQHPQSPPPTRPQPVYTPRPAPARPQPEYAPPPAYGPQHAPPPVYGPQHAPPPAYGPQHAPQPGYAPHHAAQPGNGPQHAPQPGYAPQHAAQPGNGPQQAWVIQDWFRKGGYRTPKALVIGGAAVVALVVIIVGLAGGTPAYVSQLQSDGYSVSQTGNAFGSTDDPWAYGCNTSTGLGEVVVQNNADYQVTDESPDSYDVTARNVGNFVIYSGSCSDLTSEMSADGI